MGRGADREAFRLDTLSSVAEEGFCNLAQGRALCRTKINNTFNEKKFDIYLHKPKQCRIFTL